MQPRIHLRLAPDAGASLTALFYLEAGEDVYGWYVDAGNGRFSAAFFMLEAFYDEREPSLYRSVEDDVYGTWVAILPGSAHPVRNPLPEAVRHELDRIQSRFVEEWLFFENDPPAALELATYKERGLTPMAVNVRSRRLHRLDTRLGGAREHLPPGTDRNILDFLVKHWRAPQGGGGQRSGVSTVVGTPVIAPGQPPARPAPPAGVQAEKA